MQNNITFTLSFSIYELIALAFLGGAIFSIIVGMAAYKYDLFKFVKEKF